MRKFYNEHELAKEALKNGMTGDIYAAYHVTTETHDFKEIKSGMGWKWENHEKFDYIYLFGDKNLLDEFLYNQKSVIRFLPCDGEELYSVEEFLGVVLQVHCDEETDEEYVSLLGKCGESRIEIEVWNSYEGYLNGCKRFDNGKDAEEAADKLQENGKYDVTVNF